MREKRQLARILELLDTYNGDNPLHLFLRKYFRRHPEMGSNDRRLTSQFLYNWFRLGKVLSELDRVERLAVASFLVDNKESAMINFLLNEFTTLDIISLNISLEEKLSIIKNKYPQFKMSELFPYSDIQSKGLNPQLFAESILHKPYVWLRTKEQTTNLVRDILSENNIPYLHKSNAIGIMNTTDLEKISGLKQEWYEVQDYSSQLTGQFFKPEAGDQWYDCCAASGGKSLLLHSMQHSVFLTVSDSREKILINLSERFRRNKINDYKAYLCNLEIAVPSALADKRVDGIVADVPCTGSGTWARSPEQISFFDSATLKIYTERQKNILRNVSPLVKKGKPLIYITCSVFSEENEEMVDWLVDNFSFVLEEAALIQGYEFHADTMFVARLIKK